MKTLYLLVFLLGSSLTGKTLTLNNDTYAPAANLRQKLTVKANQSITFAAIPPKPFGTADFVPGATTTSGLAVSYSSSNASVATIVNGKIHIINPGTSDITASQSGNANYNPATNVVRVLTVSKLAQTITFGAISPKVTGVADFAPGATTNSGLAINYTSSNLAVATIVSGKIHVVGPGTSAITASQAGNQVYNAASNTSQPLTVKSNQTITFATIPSKQFGTADFVPTAKASSGLAITYVSSNLAVATIVNGKIRIAGAGTATITATQPGNGSFYAAGNVSQQFTVSKANQTISLATVYSKPFGTADFAPTATAGSGLVVSFTSSNQAVATIINGKIHIVGVGTTNIIANQSGNANYNAAPSVTKPFIVNKANQSINSFPAIPSKPLNSADFSPNATASSGLQVIYTSSKPTVATIVNNKIHVVGIGITIITALQPGNGNYNLAASLTKNFTVISGSRFASDETDSLLINESGSDAILDTSPNSLPAPNFGTVRRNQISEKILGSNFVVYPNPSSSELKIEVQDSELFDTEKTSDHSFSVKLYNSEGLLVRENSETKNQNNGLSMITADLPNGLYVLQIVENKKINTRKIIIQH